jgi:hypothetical protein
MSTNTLTPLQLELLARFDALEVIEQDAFLDLQDGDPTLLQMLWDTSPALRELADWLDSRRNELKGADYP